MEVGVSSKFSPEASDYLLPPSHKVIVLMDHGPRMGIDAHCPVSITSKNAPPDRKKATMNRNLWTMAVEATLEAHRIVCDLFPDGSRLIRCVLADAVSRKLSPSWGKVLMRQPELLAQLGSTGAPMTVEGAAGNADAQFLPNGVQLAVETLSETTERYAKMKDMDPKQQLALINHLSHHFAWKIHPTKTTVERMNQEKGMKLGKATVTKTLVNPNGEEEEDKKEVKRPCFLFNKGSILVMTRMKSDEEVAALEKEVTKAIKTRNSLIDKMNEQLGTAKVDHVFLYILNLLPVGEEARITSKPLTKVNDTVSCGVRSCSVRGEELITGIHGILMPLYDLVSTTVTGIPMKEESNSSHSVNYDVELLHERMAHSELARNGLLKDVMPKVEPFPRVVKMEDDGIEIIEEKEEGETPPSPGLVAALHDGAYSTVRLTWATPSPKTAWNMFPRSRSTYPVSPAHLNARPSICLTSFLAQGKSVMLEVKNPPLAPLLTVEEQKAAIAERKERKKKRLAEMPLERRRAAENIVSRRLAERRKLRRLAKMTEASDSAKFPTTKQPKKEKKLLTKRRGAGLHPNLHNTRLISHTLIAHSGRIYIHEIALGGGTLKNELARQAAGFKPVPDLRIADFRGLMREMMICLPPKAKLLEYADKKAKGLLPKGVPPNKEARARALRLTRYWPLKYSHSFIYNVKQKLEPLFSLMRKAELSTADVDKCKQAIKRILEARDSPDLFTYTKFQCDVMSDQQNREEQLSTLLREITAHLTNYASHSERHEEVFALWANSSQEENANALEPAQLADVNVATRFDQLFKPVLEEEDALRLRLLKRAGRIPGRGSGGKKGPMDPMGECSRHSTGGGGGGTKAAEESEEEDEYAKIRAPQRAVTIAMQVVQQRERDRERAEKGGEPATKRPKVAPKFLWTSGEHREILHLLKVRQDPTMLAPRRDFVGREESTTPQAKLYPQLGDSVDRGPKPIVG